jgi:hypothetical protein
VSLTLTGKVTDEPIANAEVTATVGSQTFTATADADGAYSLEIEVAETSTGEFVTLSARGVGAQSFVEFKSLAGSFESLLSAAGTDDTLTSSENFSTQITNVSTAQAVFLEQANGGVPITTTAAMDAAALNVNAQDVLDLAAAIKLAVDDAENNPLPTGTTSILALASDANARQAFINEIVENNHDAFVAAQVAIAQDPDLAQNDGTLQRYLDNEGFTTAMLSTDGLFSFNYTGRVAHFDLYADGKGGESSETYDQQATWELNGSTIEVTYNAPVKTVSWDFVTCGNEYGQWRGEYTSEGAKLTFLNDRTVAITRTHTIAYPACPSLATVQRTETVARTVLSMHDFEVIDTEELKGNAQTFFVWDPVKQTVVADVAELNADGTGTALLTNQTFTWELNADGGVDETGKILRAEFANGSVGEYLKFYEIDELASDIFWEVRAPNDGPVHMGAGASVFADPEYAVVFTEEDVVGRFYQFGKGDETSGDSRLGGFRLRFDADGTGSEENDRIANDQVETFNQSNEADFAFRWSIDEEGPVGVEVVVSKTFNTESKTYNCEVGSANCIVWDERRIIPIVADDERADGALRVYWMEIRRSAGQGVVGPETPETKLVRFYDHEPFTGAAALTQKLKGGGKITKQRELLRGLGLK